MFYSTASHAAPVLLWSEDFESVTNTTPNSVVYDNSTAASPPKVKILLALINWRRR